MMAPSRLVEKLKIGKRFVLLDVEVAPNRGGEQIWDSTGPENKFVPVDVWGLVYKKLGELCKKQFGEGGGQRREAVKAIVDKEYEYRLEERPYYVVRYEFKDENYRDNLNNVFNEDGKRLHPGCLVVRIRDESVDLFRMLQEKQKQVEELQREKESLMALQASQEYTPAPVRTSSTGSLNHSEYIPTALNGTSPVNHGRYKPSKIEDAVKQDPDPYTPSSSQDSNSVAYVPSQKTPPLKQEPTEQKPVIVSSSAERRKTKSKRKRAVEIFGNSDEDDDEKDLPPVSSSSISKRSSLDKNGNLSDENIFSEESPAKELVASSSDEVPSGRAKLDRKTKSKIDYNLVISPPAPKAGSSSKTSSGGEGAGGGKRRRKDVTKPTKMNESLDGWLTKDTKKPSSRGKKEGESSKASSSKSTKEKKSSKNPDPDPVPFRQPVDHEKLEKENEAWRRQIVMLEQLNKMLPEDKSLLDVPFLTTAELSVAEMMTTYERYEDELRAIHEQYSGKSESEWASTDELTYFTEVTLVLTEAQKSAMMMKLERELVPPEESGKFTEFFSSVLIMEWGLRVWMKLHRYADRQEALARIKLQEEANPMEITQT